MLFFSYTDYCRRKYGSRVQKLAVDAGFGCPNRDGNLGTGGCIFCRNEAFSPSYCREAGSIGKQIDAAMAFHHGRYRKEPLYFAYLQSYSNTYAPLDVLEQRYGEALSHPAISGLVIATRPDCVDDERLDFIASLSQRHHVMVEYGIESCHDATLERIGRGHSFATTVHAIEATARRGIACCGHLILGLPGESREMMVEEAETLSQLPLQGVKLHQLQIVRGTPLAAMWQRGEALPPPFALDEYVALLCDFLERLRPDMMVERFSSEIPPRYQAAPDRGWRHADGTRVRKEEIPMLVESELTRRGSQQGMLWKGRE